MTRKGPPTRRRARLKRLRAVSAGRLREPALALRTPTLALRPAAPAPPRLSVRSER